MTELHFEASPIVRDITAIVAYTNGVALLASVVLAALGRPAGLVLAPLWLWGSIEAGRAAWSNFVKVTLTTDVLRMERSGSTDIVDLADVCWFGLTRRGVVVESTTGRFGLFDQNWKTSTEMARELGVVVRSRTQPEREDPTPLTVSHDRIRQLTNLGLLALVSMGTALVSVATVVGNLGAIERGVSLGTAVPICLWTATQAVRLARRPVRATFLVQGGQRAVELKRLYGSSVKTTEPSVHTAPTTTLTQRLSGAAPGEAVSVRSAKLSWTGPIAAPGTFDRVIESHTGR